MKGLKDDRLNRILDGEEPVENLPRDLLEEYRAYKEAISLYRIRCEYIPSSRLMEKILKARKRRKLIFSTVLTGVIASLLLLSLVFDIFPAFPSKPEVVQNQKSVVNEVINYIKTVEVVNDGW
ncbi:hypothetical protein [Thermotoga sp.]|uniref:hypothetical protein n=1 Tax=Thermotoga sp. TaxID=28240 RepID=UPI0025F8D8A9|nr:hypothetical protein [Thermotoga sp.]